MCDTAKTVVHNVKTKRDLEYHEINVMEPGQEKWKAVYEFDTPVVSSTETREDALLNRGLRFTSTKPTLLKQQHQLSSSCIDSRKTM